MMRRCRYWRRSGKDRKTVNHEPTPELLRDSARHIQDTVIPALDSVSDVSFPLVEGDLRRFPRESQEAQAAAEGFLQLRDSFDRIVAELYAGAFALEEARTLDVQLPQEIFLPLQPYIVNQDLLGSEENQHGSN
jgi:hypothetical protein